MFRVLVACFVLRVFFSVGLLFPSLGLSLMFPHNSITAWHAIGYEEFKNLENIELSPLICFAVHHHHNSCQPRRVTLKRPTDRAVLF